jgi:ABC-type nitrate/sulfonate/bicarbonate transport system substrate-binding protein
MVISQTSRKGLSTAVAAVGMIVLLAVGAGAGYFAGGGGASASAVTSTTTVTSSGTTTVTSTVGAGATATVTNTATVSNTATVTRTSTVTSGSSSGGQLIPVSVQAADAGGYLYIIASLANDLGYAREQGLNLTVLPGSSGTAPFNSVVAGTTQFGMGASGTMMGAELQGQSFTYLTLLIPSVNSIVLTKAAAAHVHSFSDLNGLTIAAGSAGGPQGPITAYLHAQLLNNYKANVTFKHFSTSPAGAAAFCQGQVDGGYAGDAEEAQELSCGGVDFLAWNNSTGYNSLAPGVYSYANGLFSLKSYASSNPQIVQKLVNALMEVKVYLHTANATQVTKEFLTNPKDAQGIDPATILVTVQKAQIFNSILLASDPIGYQSQTGWQTVQNILKSGGLITDQNSPTLSYQNMVDMSYVQNSPWFVGPTK